MYNQSSLFNTCFLMQRTGVMKEDHFFRIYRRFGSLHDYVFTNVFITIELYNGFRKAAHLIKPQTVQQLMP